ncbi:MAG: DUF1761 domain-containing protein [Pseudomonadota bacterium]
MPRIFGHDLLGVALGALAFYLVGFLIYGMVFGEYYQQINNVPAGYVVSSTSMAMGLIMPIVSTLGFAWIMNKAGKGSITAYVTTGIVLAVAIACMGLMYIAVYGPHYSFEAFGLDAVHQVLAFAAAGAVLGSRK